MADGGGTAEDAVSYRAPLSGQGLMRRYHLTFSDPKGKKMEDHGTTMTIFKKANGQWKIPYATNISEVAPQ